MMTIAFLFIALLAAPAAAPTDEWSRFRGPNGSGLSDTKGLPTEFGPTINVIWKVELPQGYSSPIVTRRPDLPDRAAERQAGDDLPRSQDREGHLGARGAASTRSRSSTRAIDPAAPSAVTDGTSFVFFFADYGLLAYDMNGKELWRMPLGPFNNLYGMGASPVIIDDLVVLNCDQNTGSFIAAVRQEDREGTLADAAPRGAQRALDADPLHAGRPAARRSSSPDRSC